MALSLFVPPPRVLCMNLNKVTKQVVQVMKQTVAPAASQLKEVQRATAPVIDAFERSVRLRVTPNGTEASVRVGGDTFGAALLVKDGPATLGAVAVKAGRVESSVGLVPSAPSPLPMPVYVGPVRDE